MSTSQSPIGVFDSGLGGLTVLKAIATRLPNENYLYLGDTARLPYGNKSNETIRKYLLQNLRFFKSKDVKAAVVACNSASSVLRPSDTVDFGFPIYSVIQPGAEMAMKATKGGPVGVIGTRATISNGVYPKALALLAPDVKVESMATPLLVPLIEEGWLDDPLTNLVLFRYLNPILQKKIDTLVLGCTHYPAITTAIRRVVGPDLPIVDSAEAMAQHLEHDLTSGKVPPRTPSHQPPPLGIHLMTTDRAEQFLDLAQKLLTPLCFEKFDVVPLD